MGLPRLLRRIPRVGRPTLTLIETMRRLTPDTWDAASEAAKNTVRES